jgi:hypothetical protein
MSAIPEFVEKRREYLRKYYRLHADIIKARSAKRFKEKREEILAKWKAKRGHSSRRKTGINENPHSAEYRKKYYYEFLAEDVIRTRFMALQKVSGKSVPECARCGMKEWLALEINHFNGNGGKETRAKTFRKFAKEIINGSRKLDDLNVLCSSCNKLYEYERGRRRLPENWKKIIEEEIARVRGVQ